VLRIRNHRAAFIANLTDITRSVMLGIVLCFVLHRGVTGMGGAGVRSGFAGAIFRLPQDA
jgi:hypothetical protein